MPPLKKLSVNSEKFVNFVQKKFFQFFKTGELQCQWDGIFILILKDKFGAFRSDFGAVKGNSFGVFELYRDYRTEKNQNKLFIEKLKYYKNSTFSRNLPF
jgi:hypothetical protein